MDEKVLVTGKFFSNWKHMALTCFMATIPWLYMGLMVEGYYLILVAVLALFGVIFTLFAFMKFELIVTNEKVIGKTLFGKRVDLPISQISVVGIGIFQRISIATSSGSINFYGLTNQNEVFSTISELLVRRQNETKITVNAPQSASDELKKLKELLDMGIITQEEFDAKKKQLLGL